MKAFIITFLTFISVGVYGQKTGAITEFPSSSTKERVKQCFYYEVSEVPKFRYDFKYDKEGLLTSVTKKHYLNNAWLPIETKEIRYDAKTGKIICEYVPSIISDGALDFDKMRELKRTKKETDTLTIKDGQLIYLVQFKKGKYNNFLNTYTYDYENNKLKSVKKIDYTYHKAEKNQEKLSKPTTSLEINFKYKEDTLIEVIEKYQDYTFRRELLYNSLGLEKINVYSVNPDQETLSSMTEKKKINPGTVELNVYMIRGTDRTSVSKQKYQYDQNNNLIMNYLFEDWGGSKYTFTYEPGKGNAEMFFLNTTAFDYIWPTMDNIFWKETK